MPTRPIRFTEETLDAIVRRYRDGESAVAIASSLAVSDTTVRKQLRLRGVSCRDGSRIHAVRHEAFDDWTDRAVAYWLGFLMGDAYVDRAGCHVSVNVGDRRHLEKLRSFAGSTQPIGARTRPTPFHHKNGAPSISSVSLNLCSRRLVISLRRAGVITAKSLVACAPDQLARSSDFWRGLVDANGTVSFGWKRGALCVSLCGSRALMGQFAAYASAVTNHPAPRVAPRGKVAYVSVHGAAAWAVTRALYEDAPDAVSLDRKRERALAMLDRPRPAYRAPRDHHS